MIDAIETITEAIPCNIVYGRKQAAEGIARALSAAGFTIMSKEDVEAVREKALEDGATTAERAAPAFQDMEYEPLQSQASRIADAIRSLKSIPHKE